MIGVYGDPPFGLVDPAPDAVQLSPMVVDSAVMETMPDRSFERLVVLAPPGTIERRYVLAQALRLLEPGGELLALASKTRGGARLGAELTAFGCAVHEHAKAHHRICRCERPEVAVGLEAAIAAGAPQVPPALGLWSQPGLFSWDRLDPGSALLMRCGEPFAGSGADLGCGYGVLSLAALRSEAVKAITLVDTDRRAVDAARRNVTDPRASFIHGDARDAALTGLDFVVVNPPFHVGGQEDRALGRAMVASAAEMLRRGGVCRVVANVALPYEATLAANFASVTLLGREGGFKVLEARR